MNFLLIFPSSGSPSLNCLLTNFIHNHGSPEEDWYVGSSAREWRQGARRRGWVRRAGGAGLPIIVLFYFLRCWVGVPSFGLAWRPTIGRHGAYFRFAVGARDMESRNGPVAACGTPLGPAVAPFRSLGLVLYRRPGAALRRPAWLGTPRWSRRRRSLLSIPRCAAAGTVVRPCGGASLLFFASVFFFSTKGTVVVVCRAGDRCDWPWPPGLVVAASKIILVVGSAVRADRWSVGNFSFHCFYFILFYCGRLARRRSLLCTNTIIPPGMVDLTFFAY